MRYTEPRDTKAHPAGRVLGEAVYTLRTDNAGRGVAVSIGTHLILPWRCEYPAVANLALTC